ncbi:hypothetical protein MASR2M48_26000 [Spirochaetota bacterium]
MMNGLDYVLIAIIVLAALRCWFRGIIGEVLSMAAILEASLRVYSFTGRWVSGSTRL